MAIGIRSGAGYWRTPPEYEARARRVIGSGGSWLDFPTKNDLAALLERLKAGEQGETIVLMHNNTSTRLFHALAPHGSVCFPRGRIKAIPADPGRKPSSPTGADVPVFWRGFGQIRR
jgi:hypothetical protein